jgi:primase-polymerase (primpol)-like protein
MASYKQFLLWKKVNGTKMPVDRAGDVCSAHNPAAWMSYDEAESLAEQTGFGIAFVFTENDPFFFLDIDHCLVDGDWSDVAKAAMASLPGCAIEVSQSREGLHIFGKYCEISPHSCKNSQYGLELYHQGRFVALTQMNMVGSIDTDMTAYLPGVINSWFPAVEVDEKSSAWTTEPVDEWSGIEEDDKLIEVACKAKSAGSVFGGRATFRDLWEGNEEVLAGAYPTQNQTDTFDRSSADAALAQHLAFWTGKNCERMERLMRRSALVRDKWDKHKNYMSMTIISANQKQQDVMQSKRNEPVAVTQVLGANVKDGYDYMGLEEQAAYFKDCWYIIKQHCVFSLEHGMLKPDQFKATFSGKHFATDNDKTTKNAWEAFVESTVIEFPKVTSTCFRPDLAPGMVITDEGETKVNTYMPSTTRRRQGDITPFT